ncbi:hypothetical protein IEO21_09889 [Rhodonia placenta]|uniref:Uncharacterized protein n=1 Tax=Rhodonia placenta TaxID=104341 RepID=A0A8H7NTH4_9APHY|nr:hypothetical protein IEO21_09889 [Postia placenta]
MPRHRHHRSGRGGGVRSAPVSRTPARLPSR